MEGIRNPGPHQMYQNPRVSVETRQLGQLQPDSVRVEMLYAGLCGTDVHLIETNPETGYIGLLEGKKAYLALTSGAFAPSMPSPAFGVDHHSTYLRSWLNQAGVTDITDLRFQPTLLTADPEADLAAAQDNARAAA